MNCPKCKENNIHVIDSREVDNTVRRRRECLSCKHRWTTYEISEATYDKAIPVTANKETLTRLSNIMLTHLKTDIPIMINQYISGVKYGN